MRGRVARGGREIGLKTDVRIVDQSAPDFKNFSDRSILAKLSLTATPTTTWKPVRHVPPAPYCCGAR